MHGSVDIHVHLQMQRRSTDTPASRFIATSESKCFNKLSQESKNIHLSLLVRLFGLCRLLGKNLWQPNKANKNSAIFSNRSHRFFLSSFSLFWTLNSALDAVFVELTRTVLTICRSNTVDALLEHAQVSGWLYHTTLSTSHMPQYSRMILSHPKFSDQWFLRAVSPQS